MIKRIAVGVTCAVGLGAWAASVTLTSSSGDLALAQALANAGASVSDLTGNVYDDIVVAGDGRILFDTDISAYTGTIHVSSGARAVVKAVGGLGAKSGKVYVADGGALISDATGFAAGTFTMEKAEIHISGSGPDGVGAMVAKADANQRGTGLWGGNAKYVLEGDALISSRVTKSAVIDFPKQSPSTSVVNLDMNGHTLTFAPSGCYIPVRMVVGNPGHIVVTNANLSMNNVVRLNGSSSNTFTFRDDGYANFFNMSAENQAPWTLVYDSSQMLNAEQSDSRWDGPVSLLRDLTIRAKATSNNGVYFNPKMHLYGPVRGAYKLSFVAERPDLHIGELSLYSDSSTFSGGMFMGAQTYLHVMSKGAVPAAGGTLALSNAVLDVQASSCVLPSVDYFCSDTRTVDFSGDILPGRIAGTLTKRGGGTLDYTWPSCMDGIDLKAGTLKVANAPTAWYAGVYEGNTNIATWWASGDNTTAVAFFDGKSTITNNQQLSLRWTTQAASFSKNGACTYDGWLYCPANEAGTWRFATSIKATGALFIDGNTSSIVGRQSSDQVCFGNATMTEGWHHFTYRIGRNSKSTGPNTSVTKAYESGTEITSKVDSDVLAAWAASGLGLAVCKDSAKALAKTTNVVDFAAFPSDPGDGSVLRLFEPGSAAETALFESLRTIKTLSAATNTVLDLCGVPLVVGAVTGFPTVVHTDIPAWLVGSTPNLTVTNSWTASAEGIASGAAFTVTGGALTFADGATLKVPDSLMLRDTRGGSLTLATATGGIVGMPTLVFAEGDRRGVLSKSQDEKSLLLTVFSGLTIIFR